MGDSLSTLLLLFSIVILAFGALLGAKRTLYSTILRFITLVLSAIAAYVLAKNALYGASGTLIDTLKGMTDGALDTYLNDPELAGLTSSLAVMLVAPIFFLLFYIVIKLLSWIVYKIFASALHLKGPGRLGHLLGAVGGVVCGFLTLVVLVTPIFGYADLVLKISDTTTDDSLTELVDPIQAIRKTPIASQAYAMLGETLFNGLTTADWEDTEINLNNEADILISVVNDAMPLLEKPMAEYGPEESAAIQKMAQDVGRSPVLCTVISSVLADTSKAWLNGEEALGVSKPEAGEELQGIVDSLLVVFATSDRTNIGADLTTFADIMSIMIDNELFALAQSEGGTDALAEKLSSGGVAAELYQTLGENPRMQGVQTTVTNTGVRMLLNRLGDVDQLRENHGEMLESIATELKEHRNEDGTLNKEELTGKLNQVINDYDIEVGEDLTSLVVDGVAEAFTPEELDTMTTDEMVDRLIEYFTNTDKPIEIPEDLLDKIPENFGSENAA